MKTVAIVKVARTCKNLFFVCFLGRICMLKECGVVTEDNRKRKGEKEKERMKKQRATITKEEKKMLFY